MTSRANVAGAMRFAVLFSIAGVMVGVLTGCGGASSAPPPPGSPLNITGNWEFRAYTTPTGAVPLEAYLASNAGTVTGTAKVEVAFPMFCANGCCGGPFYQFNGALTGTVDAEGNLTLGSAVPGGGPVFAMAGTVSGGTLTNGSFTLTGNCAAQGTMAGTEYPPLEGTYSGMLTSQNMGQSFGFSTTLNQGSTLNSEGYFDVNGTASLSGYPCATSAAAATPLDMNSGLLGDGFNVGMNATPGGTLYLSGTLSPDSKTLAVSYFYFLTGSTCNNDMGQGTLTLQ